MSRIVRARILSALRTDLEARLDDGVWTTRCIHCRAKLSATEAGEPLGSATLEHIVPRAWFGRREAEDLVAEMTGPEDPRNLALACARCNHGKGKGPDRKGPGDPRAREIVGRLLAKRRRMRRESL